MTSQQIQTIILSALVANAALIVAALLTTRFSRARTGEARELDVKATHETMLAMAAAGTGAFGPPASARAGGSESTDTTYFETAAPPPLDPPAAGPLGDAAADLDDAGPRDDRISLTDPRTGLESPQAWEHAVADEVPRLGRYHRSATVMFVELDGFTRLTDRLGADAGTRIEVATARTLRAQARAADRCARLGAGRFGILLPETDEIRAINFGERIREECDRWLEAGEVALRLAIGWAILDPAAGAKAALQEAERRLAAERREAPEATP